MGNIEKLRDYLNKNKKDCIVFNIDGKVDFPFCISRFGGAPDVPRDFEWPRYRDFDFEGELKNRPLAFLAQINCEEASKFDKEGILPDHGILSFFYEMEAEPWGYSPDEKGGARVFWFDDTSKLVSAIIPEDLDKDYVFPTIKIGMEEGKSVPSFQDLDDYIEDIEFEELYAVKRDLGIDEEDNISKLLGYSDTIQDNIGMVCELVSRGHNIGGDWKDIPREDIEESEKISSEKWQLLFQIDAVDYEDFELMFGDMGRLYFYITRDDLKNRRFDNIWAVVQCY